MHQVSKSNQYPQHFALDELLFDTLHFKGEKSTHCNQAMGNLSLIFE